MAASPDIEVPYLVVGAGPVGMSAAVLLGGARRGCLVIDRRPGPLRGPAAHVVNARTLEIFRQAGVDPAAIRSISQDPSTAGHVNFVTRLNGTVIGRLPFERQGDDCLEFTPTPLRNIAQHRLEPVLAAAAADRPGTDLRYGMEWVSSDQDTDGVSTILRRVGSDEELTVRSSYVVAADGAGSGIRKSLGIEMIGPANLQSYVAIHARADLDHLIASRPGVLHFVMDPEASASLVRHGSDEWVCMVRFDDTAESLADFGPQRCTEIFRAAVGEDVPVDVIGVGSWNMSAQIAERMRSDRIFLVGDAAHRFPPTGGLGLNTGVADAHNLAWKLLAVDEGWATERLLDTYEPERRPVAETNSQQSVENAFKMILLADALGLHPGVTSSDLDRRLADPTNRTAIADAVREQTTHFDMIGLQLGYGYGPEATAVVDPSVFRPDASPGTRLPHAWLDDGRSTLDLIDGRWPALISVGDHDRWARGVTDPFVRHVRHVRLDAPTTWLTTTRLGPTGALLVRPDQHIARRWDDAPADPGAAVRSALTELLR